jgi:hypothetical protein
MSATTASGQPVKNFGPRLFISLLPLIGLIFFKLLEISLETHNEVEAAGKVAVSSFWNLSFDLFCAALGIYLGSVMFADKPADSRALTWSGVSVAAISLVVLFFVILLNLLLPRFGILAQQAALRTIVADGIALACFAFCVQAI